MPSGDLEDIGIRVQQDVVGVAAVKVGAMVKGPVDAVGPPVGADGRSPCHGAPVAVAAADAPVPHNGVTGRQGLAVHGVLLAPYLHHLANPFVAQSYGQGGAGVHAVPHVHVGAADARGGDPDQHLAGLWIGDGHVDQF